MEGIFSNADVITYVDKFKEKVFNGEINPYDYWYTAFVVGGKVRLFPSREKIKVYSGI